MANVFRRPFSRALPRRLAALSACLLFGLVGCRPNDDIRQSTEPKPVPVEAQNKPSQRLLGAVTPAEGDGDKWFFLLMGPDESVTPHEEDFKAFLKTVKLTGDARDPIQFTPPAGWRKGQLNQFRHAAFIMGEPGKEVLLTVSSARGTLADNLRRYSADYMGRRDFSEADVPKYTEEMEIGGQKGVLVNMTGPGGRLLAKREVK